MLYPQSMFGEETLGEIITVNRPRCEVCKSPNLVEIELLLARGTGLRKLAGVTKFSESILRSHQKYCMRERMERLEATMGAVIDLEATMGAAGMLTKAYNKADKLADVAMGRNELGLAGFGPSWHPQKAGSPRNIVPRARSSANLIILVSPWVAFRKPVSLPPS